MGASAVQLGTAFIQCSNSNASPAFRHALTQNPVTCITSCISGRPARGLVNTWTSIIDTPDHPTVPPYPYAYALCKDLHAIASNEKDDSYGPFLAGANVSMNRFLSATDLINLLVQEMN